MNFFKFDVQKFSSRGALLWHIMEKHSNEKLLRCSQCGIRFGDRDQVSLNTPTQYKFL